MSDYVVLDKNYSASNVYVGYSDDLLTAKFSRNNVIRTNIGRVSGKWYWEVTCDYRASNTSNPLYKIGVCSGSYISSSLGNDKESISLSSYSPNGIVYGNSTVVNVSSSGFGFSEDDIVGVYLDIENKKIDFYVNGIFSASYTGFSFNEYYPAICANTSSTSTIPSHGATFNFGDSPFHYQKDFSYKPYNNRENAQYVLQVESDNYVNIKSVELESKKFSLTNNYSAVETRFSTSGTATNSNLSYLCDDLASTSWLSTAPSASVTSHIAWLIYNFTIPVYLTKYSIMADDNFLSYAPKTIRLEASKDGLFWDTIERRTIDSWKKGESKVFEVDINEKYRKFRIVIINTIGNVNQTRLSEVKFTGILYENLNIYSDTFSKDFLMSHDIEKLDYRFNRLNVKSYKAESIGLCKIHRVPLNTEKFDVQKIKYK